MPLIDTTPARYTGPMGTLYLVGTPIGNPEDVTLRALRVLRDVSLVAAEDTRTARRLLALHGIRAPLLSYNDHNKAARIPRILEVLDAADVALVSEAGMPAVSDPGRDLVAAAAARGVRVVPVPGPSAVLAALAVSGLPAREFTYLGFLPRRSGERRRLFQRLAAEGRTAVAFESPRRLRAALADALAVLGDRRVAVCRELTKTHEEVFRGTISQALDRFPEPLGEITLVLEGAPAPAPTTGGVPEEVLAELRRLKAQGLSARDAAAGLAVRTGLPRRALYQAWHRIR
ncbi:MAG TPA: 16S rRNA (cytidine(1402)-2'-O)-methyltransferase [Dehalococcoidia bacterium]